MTTPLRPLPSGRPRSRSTSSVLPWILAGVGALVALNLIIVAVYVGGRGNEVIDLPPAIDSVFPAPNSVIRPQESVGANLAEDHTGIVFIDDVRIPEDQLILRPGEVLFRPGEGLEITRLAPGPHRATIKYWPQEKATDEQQADAREIARSFTWQFTAG